MDRKYANVYVPFDDVYQLSGNKTFQHFQNPVEGKVNLVVVPYEFIENLSDSASAGSNDVLDFLKKETKRSRDVEVSDSERGLSILQPKSGLEIAVLQPPEIKFNNREFSIHYLMDTIKATFDSETPAKLITSNPKHHIKFGARDILVEDPHFLMVNADIVNEGIISGSEELLARLYEKKHVLPMEEARSFLKRDELYLNQFIRFEDKDKKHEVYARVAGDVEKKGTRIVGVKNLEVKILDPKEHPRGSLFADQERNNILGITPNDMEQYLAMRYGLLNPDVSLFFITGSQGSGKTLLEYVCGVDQILFNPDNKNEERDPKSGLYKKILIFKPNELMGGNRREVGALPGSLYDKLKPHLMPFIDSHKEAHDLARLKFEEMLRHPDYSTDFGDKRTERIKIGGCYLPKDNEAIEIAYSGFIRGRSFRNAIIIIDEAQNFTPYEVKTIIERAGEGCKIIISGDPLQTDNPLCSVGFNGLTHAIAQYLDKPYSALVNLSQNYRSQMSDDARDWKVFAK